MNHLNYDKMMNEVIAQTNGTHPSLLLHACCAPCSSSCLERLHDAFRVTVLFYNPNIEDEEYQKRKSELIRFLDETGWADYLDCDHEKQVYYDAVKGLENQPEGGKRCRVCFALRLKKAVEVAEQNAFDYVTTTLTVSPLKDATLLNTIGSSLCEATTVKWLPSDFKKRNGYLRSCQLSEEHHLYRQNYCGCIYSQNQGQNPLK